MIYENGVTAEQLKEALNEQFKLLKKEKQKKYHKKKYYYKPKGLDKILEVASQVTIPKNFKKHGRKADFIRILRDKGLNVREIRKFFKYFNIPVSRELVFKVYHEYASVFDKKRKRKLVLGLIKKYRDIEKVWEVVHKMGYARIVSRSLVESVWRKYVQGSLALKEFIENGYKKVFIIRFFIYAGLEPKEILWIIDGYISRGYLYKVYRDYMQNSSKYSWQFRMLTEGETQ
jgi:hypothetical protein